MNLLLHRSLTIDQHDLERITQAVLFYAQAVTVRAAAAPANGDKRIYRRINELIDLGLVRTWAHEYEVTWGGRLRKGTPFEPISSQPPQHVVTVEAVRDLAKGVDLDLRHGRHPRPQAGLQEGISEIVQLRHSLGTLRLAEHLGADGVVLGPGRGASLVDDITRVTRPVDLRETVVREVVSRCRFGPLAHLPLDVIQDCRKETARFSAFLDRHLEPAAGEDDPRLAPLELAEQIIAEYRKVARPVPEPTPTYATSVWDVVGAVLPPAVALKVIGGRIEWFRRQSRTRPFMLLGKLTRYHAT